MNYLGYLDYFLAGWIANIIGLGIISILTVFAFLKLGLVEGEKFSQDIKVLKERTRTDLQYKFTVLCSYFIPFYLFYMSIIYIILIIKNKILTSSDYIDVLIKYEKYQIYRSFKDNKDVC